MSGEHNGVQAIIRRQAKAAVFVHCSSHLLNLAICAAASQPEIYQVFDVISRTAAFFNKSPKRYAVLERAIEAVVPDTKKKAVKGLCEVRWSERHEAIENFVDLLPAILAVLVHLEQDPSTECAEAGAVLGLVRQPEFIFALALVDKVMLAIRPLVKVLQQEKIDLFRAKKCVSDFLGVIDNWRAGEGVGSYANIKTHAYAIATAVAENGFRRSKRSAADLTNDYDVDQSYFLELHVPFLEEMAEAFKSRFGPAFELVAQMQHLLPWNVCNTTFSDVKPVLDFYRDSGHVTSSISTLESEYEMWKQRCKHFDLPDKEQTLVTAIQFCSDVSFPEFNKLLKIFATIPVTSATAERSFSALRLLKTYLRSTMGQERLSSLAMPYIHKNLDVKADEILDEFAKKNHRLLL